jgi:uncharacterized protein (DUF302 family)
LTRQSNSTASIERSTVSTGLTYPALVAAFESELGRFDPADGARLVERQTPWSEVERDVGRAAGPHGLMIVGQANQGAIASLSGHPTKCSLYLVGNPVIAAGILRIDVRASLYVPFRVCLYDDGDPGGARIAFDRPSSSLATLGRPELTDVAKLLDQKIDGVVAAIARSSVPV